MNFFLLIISILPGDGVETHWTPPQVVPFLGTMCSNKLGGYIQVCGVGRAVVEILGAAVTPSGDFMAESKLCYRTGVREVCEVNSS